MEAGKNKKNNLKPKEKQSQKNNKAKTIKYKKETKQEENTTQIKNGQQVECEATQEVEQTLGEISSSQVYTKEVFCDFADFTVKSNKTMVLIYVCAVIILMCSIAMFSFGDIASGIIYACLGIFFAFYGKFIKFIMLRNNQKNIGNKDVYVFSEDSFKVDTYNASNNQISSTTIMYENLYSVKKYKSYGFIFVNKAVAYIVNMQNFKDIVDFNFALIRIENAINSKKMQTM